MAEQSQEPHETLYKGRNCFQQFLPFFLYTFLILSRTDSQTCRKLISSERLNMPLLVYHKSAIRRFLDTLPSVGVDPGSRFYAVRCFDTVLKEDATNGHYNFMSNSEEPGHFTAAGTNYAKRTALIAAVVTFLIGLVVCLTGVRAGRASGGFHVDAPMSPVTSILISIPAALFIAFLLFRQYGSEGKTIRPSVDYISQVGNELSSVLGVPVTPVSINEARKYLAYTYGQFYPQVNQVLAQTHKFLQFKKVVALGPYFDDDSNFMREDAVDTSTVQSEWSQPQAQVPQQPVQQFAQQSPSQQFIPQQGSQQFAQQQPVQQVVPQAPSKGFSSEPVSQPSSSDFESDSGFLNVNRRPRGKFPNIEY